MPLTVKQAAFCRWLFTPGSETFGNQTESARKAQYKGSDNTLACVGKDNVRKPQIIAEKQRIQAISAEAMELSRDKQHKKLNKAYEIAEKAKNPAAMTSAVREQNEMLGYHRDKAPNAERTQEIRARMDQEELRYRQEFTVRRCTQEAKLRLNEG